MVEADTTEKFCKDKAVNNAVLNGIKIWMEKTRKETQSVPSILSEALVCLLIIILGTITLMTQMIDLIGIELN